MFKERILLFFILFSSYLIAQNKVNEIDLKLDDESVIFEITDSKSKEVLLYYKDTITSKVYKTNEKLTIVDSLYLEKPSDVFVNYLGHCKKNNEYSIYWSNKKNDLVHFQNINFETKQLFNKQIQLDLNKEKILKTISTGSNFYIISIPRKGNVLNFHKFTSDRYEKKTIDFKGQTFYLKDNIETQSLWEALGDGFFNAYEIQTISSEIPTSLPLTKNKRKIYIKNENELVLTFDSSPFVTQLVSVKLDRFTYTVKNFEKSFLPSNYEGEVSNSNSFICNTHVFQIISNSEIILIDIKDIDGKLIKSFKIEKDKEIDFVNSNILQENMSISGTRILDKSNQLIRKLNNLNLGLTVHFKDNNYYLTIGGFSEVQNNNTMMYGAMFGLTGVLIASAFTPNYPLQNINSYANRKVVYVSSILDLNLDHIKSKTANPTAFDKMRLFIEENNKWSNPFVYSFDQKTFFAGYNKKTKKLTFFSFED